MAPVSAALNLLYASPAKALDAFLKTVEGADAKLYRLYPRDFWMTGD